MNRVTDMTTSALARPAITCRRNGADRRGAGDESIRAGVMRAAAAAPTGVGRAALGAPGMDALVVPGGSGPALVVFLDHGIRAAPAGAAARLGAARSVLSPNGTRSPSKLGSRLSAASTSFPCAIAFFNVARSEPKTDSNQRPMLLEVGRSLRGARNRSSASENAWAVPKRATRCRESACNTMWSSSRGMSLRKALGGSIS